MQHENILRFALKVILKKVQNISKEQHVYIEYYIQFPYVNVQRWSIKANTNFFDTFVWGFTESYFRKDK